MTLVIGCRWRMGDSDTILVTSDSKITTSLGITYEMRKVFPIYLDEERPVAVAGVAGDTSLAKQGVEVAEEVLQRYARDAYPIEQNRFKMAVSEIERQLVRRFSELRSYGVDPSFQMILGSLDLEGKGSLYLFDSRGLCEPVHDNPGYAIIGSGMVTGGILLLRLIGFDPTLELGLLSAFIVDSVSEVDSSVGPFIGDSFLMRLATKDNKKKLALGPLKDESLIEYKNKIKSRKEIIRRLWKSCDELGEEKIIELLGSIKQETADSKDVNSESTV